MEVALWGGIRIRLSSGDPSSPRINALKFSVFTRNGLKEAASAALGARRRAGGGASAVGNPSAPWGTEGQKDGKKKVREERKEGRSVLF